MDQTISDQTAVSSEGSLNSVFSIAFRKHRHVTGSVRRNALTTPSTSTSSAEAPAVQGKPVVPCGSSALRPGSGRPPPGTGPDVSQPGGTRKAGPAGCTVSVPRSAGVSYRRLAVLCRMADIQDINTAEIVEFVLQSSNYVTGGTHVRDSAGTKAALENQVQEALINHVAPGS